MHDFWYIFTFICSLLPKPKWLGFKAVAWLEGNCSGKLDEFLWGQIRQSWLIWQFTAMLVKRVLFQNFTGIMQFNTTLNTQIFQHNNLSIKWHFIDNKRQTLNEAHNKLEWAINSKKWKRYYYPALGKNRRRHQNIKSFSSVIVKSLHTLLSMKICVTNNNKL